MIKSVDLTDAVAMLAHREKLRNFLKRMDALGTRLRGPADALIADIKIGGREVEVWSSLHPQVFDAIRVAVVASIAGCEAELRKIGVEIVEEGEPTTYERERMMKEAIILPPVQPTA